MNYAGGMGARAVGLVRNEKKADFQSAFLSHKRLLSNQMEGDL